MSVNAILDTTLALRRRIAAAAGGAIFVGPPVREALNGKTVSLFLFQVEASRDLRNVDRPAPAQAAGPFAAPAERVSALPLDLRYMISVFRTAGAGSDSDPVELGTLGAIMSALHADPVLTETEVEGQTVRVTLEPASLDDINRVWGIFPEESYQTSVIYLATPVWVEAGSIRVGPPVLEHEQKAGIAKAPPSLAGAGAA